MDYRVFRFDRFVLDPASRELTYDGERVGIPPKSLECLEYLVRNRARAVGRDELISAVWGRADVSDALLAQTLLRARRAVGDTGNDQGTIRTVPRFGYQWVASVEECEREANFTHPGPTNDQSQAAAVAQAPSTAGKVPDAGRRSPARLSGAFMALVLVVAGLLVWWTMKDRAPTEPANNLYVVAPVTMTDKDIETAWVRFGVMDYVATRLREDGKLSVLPSQRVVALVGAASPDAEDQAGELMAVTSASHLVQPSANRQPGGWQVTLTVSGTSGLKEHVGEGTTPLTAASQAVDSMLAGPGGSQANAESNGTSDSLQESLQRLDVAMLEGNLSGARSVLAAIPPALRESPKIRVREGQILFRGGRIDDADSVFSGLQARLSQLPTDVQAQSLMGLGAVAVRRRDFPAAELRYSEALAVLGEQGSQELVGNGYNGRGVSRAAQQQFELALSDFSRARIALGRAGDAPGVASIDTNLGLLEARRGQWTQALQAFDRAIDVFGRYRIEDNLAAALLGKSRVQLAVVDFAPALQTSERARTLAADLENPVLGNQIAALRANILLRTGSLAAAAQLVDGLAASDPSDGASEIAIELALARGRNASALELARQLESQTASGRSVYLLVRAAIASDQDGQALDPLFESFWQLDETLKYGGISDRVNAQFGRAIWQAYRGSGNEATATFEQTLAMMDRSIEPSLRLEVISQYVEFLVATGRLDRATDLSGTLEGYSDRDYRAARALALLYRALGDSTLLDSARFHMRELAGERAVDLPSLARAAPEAES